MSPQILYFHKKIERKLTIYLYYILNLFQDTNRSIKLSFYDNLRLRRGT